MVTLALKIKSRASIGWKYSWGMPVFWYENGTLPDNRLLTSEITPLLFVKLELWCENGALTS